MEIQEYDFGWIKIDGKIYENDLIIFPDRIFTNWWREEGHYLKESDIFEVFLEKPEVLIIGTGANGLMKIDEGVIKKAKELGIELIIENTYFAVKKFNEMSKIKKTIAALHLTC
jgi:hypothetical protein